MLSVNGNKDRISCRLMLVPLRILELTDSIKAVKQDAIPP